MVDLEDDIALRRLCYLTAFLLILLPLFQAMAASWPTQLGQVRWRMFATSNIVQALQLPYLGFVIMLAIARDVRDASITRTVGIVAAAFTAGLTVAIGLFVLDSLQLRSIVTTRDMPGFNNAFVRILFALIVSILSFAVLTYVSFKSPRHEAESLRNSSKRTALDEPVGFLIGQDLSK